MEFVQLFWTRTLEDLVEISKVGWPHLAAWSPVYSGLCYIMLKTNRFDPTFVSQIH